MKSKARSIVALVASGAAVMIAGLVALVLAGVDGEVFLVSPTGQAELSPGASVRIYRETGGRNLSGFSTVRLPLDRKHADASYSIAQRMAEAGKSMVAGKLPAPDAELIAHSLSQKQDAESDKYCNDLYTAALSYFGVGDAETTTARGGTFHFWALPGKYVIWVSGQAGAERAEWMEQVSVRWRSQVRLVKPMCKYPSN